MKTTQFTLLVILLLLTCCSKLSGTQVDSPRQEIHSFQHEEMNSIYYWKTILDFDSTDYAYLKRHNIERVYVRFFDIVEDTSPIATEKVVPNATLQVKETVIFKNIIPTIYITLDALKQMKNNESEWAQKIVKRVSNICSYNEWDNLTEIQLDCDWTKSTEDSYFKLCSAVKEALCEYNPQAILSSTIRLHQLSMSAPPTDYGVLMLYNTGSFKNPEAENSILSTKDVEPYLKYLDTYPLHIDIAYPTYSWILLYSNNTFRGILHTDFESINEYVSRISNNRYRISSDCEVDEKKMYEGDIIRLETSAFSTLKEVKSLIEKYLNTTPHSNILYHYDSNNLYKYTDDEISEIFN